MPTIKEKTSYSVRPSTRALLTRLAKHLGLSRSETVETAIRALATKSRVA